MDPRAESEAVAQIVCEAGGELIGRVKLQKIGYLLQEAGLGYDFSYEYKHYGPYSESLARAAKRASFLEMIDEEEKLSKWGSYYSVYTSRNQAPPTPIDENRKKLTELANGESPVVLELAATALYLFKHEGDKRPWETTVQRKPDKAANFLDPAKQFYTRLRTEFTVFPDLPGTTTT